MLIFLLIILMNIGVMPPVPIFYILIISHEHSSLFLYLLHMEIDTMFQKETPHSLTFTYQVLNLCLCLFLFYLLADTDFSLGTYLSSSSSVDQKLQAGRLWPCFLYSNSIHSACFTVVIWYIIAEWLNPTAFPRAGNWQMNWQSEV